MNKNIKVLLTVAVVIAIVGSYQFPKVQQTVTQVLGAVSTLDGVDNPYVTIGGMKEYRQTINMAATSSAICSMKNPFGATSTIVSLSAVSSNVGIAQANDLLIATTSSTSRYATSTTNSWNLGFAMGTGEWSFDFVKATTSDLAVYPNVLEGSNLNGSSNYIVGPTDNVNFMIGTSTGGSFVTYDAGFCSYVWRAL